MEKLRITEIGKSNDDSYIAMLNPNSIKLTQGINYNDCESGGTGLVASTSEFSGYATETLAFDFMLDGTGVVKGTESNSEGQESKRAIVSDALSKLQSVVYNYNGDEHEPNIVNISWGTLLFEGRLTSLSVDYTLFSSDGSPLRAKLSLAFKGYKTKKKILTQAKQQSPDLTHLIKVKAGDSLPLLCQKIYHDGSYCIEVAKYNNLLSFRHLLPGQSLYFPPLK
ncbi:MAG: peptidoglycan-binding protein [Psychromonas sp.]